MAAEHAGASASLPGGRLPHGEVAEGGKAQMSEIAIEGLLIGFVIGFAASTFVNEMAIKEARDAGWSLRRLCRYLGL
jgi:hypothetical protein